MKTLAPNASDPDDASPFSAAVVAAQFDKPTIPASFNAGNAPMTLHVRTAKKNGRAVYAFTQVATRSNSRKARLRTDMTNFAAVLARA